MGKKNTKTIKKNPKLNRSGHTRYTICGNFSIYSNKISRQTKTHHEHCSAVIIIMFYVPVIAVVHETAASVHCKVH